MARKRDVIVGLIIAFCFVIFVGIMAVGLMGMYDDGQDFLALLQQELSKSKEI